MTDAIAAATEQAIHDGLVTAVKALLKFAGMEDVCASSWCLTKATHSTMSVNHRSRTLFCDVCIDKIRALVAKRKDADDFLRVLDIRPYPEKSA